MVFKNSNQIVYVSGKCLWEYLDNVSWFIKICVPDTTVKLCFYKASDFTDVAMLLVKSGA
jgi:hypothetical protein